ncbi:hypothetical protein H4P12_17850 [Paracoccus sp. 11-3]|uniref:O-antigen ligase-like membrane protein n=1 Tax=Paracoccus amoyensis TaxID=2760093 RepID=A0A926JE60_9RHOB|nr:hypothetical protein [Paracoccus amoyensis]MBC9248529.1 hypothetical protein [Paracoccus amoyensis]
MIVGSLVMLIWPLVIFWLFAKRQPAVAVTTAIVGGYLLLPGNISFDFPAIPVLNKHSITALCTAVAAMIFLNRSRTRTMPAGMVLDGAIPRSPMVRALMIMMVVGIFGTVVTNGDGLRYGGTSLGGLRLYDAASMLGSTIFAMLPFLLARKYIAHPDAQRLLLVSLAMAGLIYSIPTLYEVRMSPQLSRIIYDYFPHQWLQHVRAGGFRPVVFLHHGLWLAIFFCSCFLAALALWRSSAGKPKITWMLATLWLFATLAVSKGMGALAIGLLLGAIIFLLPTRLQILAAAIFAGIVLVYPMLRGANVIPVQQIVNIAADINAERAGSLSFRLKNEDLLLERANERPLFGWGLWGRNRVYDETGQDISTTDGYWVMSIGTSGWIGYLAEFGLLTLPLIFLALRWRELALTPTTAGIALALTANLLDLIPNATLTPVTWLLAGALAGRLELGRLSQPDDAIVMADDLPVRRNAYSRQVKRHPPHAARSA